MSDNLRDRVHAFQAMELPGQPMMMHMGTIYLVNDLWHALAAKDAEIGRLREALGVIAYEQPEDAWCVAHDALKASAVPLAAGEDDQ